MVSLYAWVRVAKTNNRLLSLLLVPLGYPLYLLIKGWVARPGPSMPAYAWIHDLSIGYWVEGLVRRQISQMPRRSQRPRPSQLP